MHYLWASDTLVCWGVLVTWLQTCEEERHGSGSLQYEKEGKQRGRTLRHQGDPLHLGKTAKGGFSLRWTEKKKQEKLVRCSHDSTDSGDLEVFFTPKCKVEFSLLIRTPWRWGVVQPDQVLQYIAYRELQSWTAGAAWVCSIKCKAHLPRGKRPAHCYHPQPGLFTQCASPPSASPKKPCTKIQGISFWGETKLTEDSCLPHEKALKAQASGATIHRLLSWPPLNAGLSDTSKNAEL